MKDHPLVLKTVDQALATLQKLINESEYCPDEIHFEGELTSLNITIKGDKYNGSFPATLAKELWYFQEEFYRAVLFSLGRNEHLSSLTIAEKEQYLITFNVTKGSTEIDAIIKTILNGLLAGYATMDSKHKMITVIGIAIVFATGYYGHDSYNHKQDVELEQIKIRADVEKEKEKTKQFEVFKSVASSNKEVARFAEAVKDSSQAILKASPDAESVKIGYTKYDEEDIANATKRAPRMMSNTYTTTGDFFISTTDYRHSEMTKYTLRDSKGIEFPIEIDHTKFKDENIDKLQMAAKGRQKLNLTIEFVSLKDNIKSATLNKIN